MSRFQRANTPRKHFLYLLAGGIALTFWLAFCLPPVQAALAPQIVTTTPMPDGAIVHVVQSGENLASISEAYGVSMADIRGLNGMAANSNLIFPGQNLIIRLPLPPTETPTLTPSVPRPTRTPTLVTPTRTPRATRTVTPTLLPSPTRDPAAALAANFFTANQRLLLIGMIAVCALGLIGTLWAGFRPSVRKNKN
jgi:LysM repeat protein